MYLIVAFVCLIAMLWLCSRGAQGVLAAVLIFTPFSLIDYHYFGLPLALPDLVLLGAVGFVLLRIVADRRKIPGVFWFGLILYFCFSALSWLYGSGGLFGMETAHYAAALQPPNRAILTFVQRLLFILVILVPLIDRSEINHDWPARYLFYYVLSTSIHSVLAVSCYFLTEFFGPAFVFGRQEVASFNGVIRASGYVGEPRHLAMLLAPSLYLLFIRGGFSIGSSKAINVSIKVFHLMAFVMAFSTAGVFLVGLYYIVNVANQVLKARSKSFLKALFVGVFGFGFIIGIPEGRDFLNEKVVQRADVDVILSSEFNSAASFELIASRPAILLLGLGPGLSPYFIKEMTSYSSAYGSTLYDPWYFIRNPPGVLVLLMEYGLAGFCVLAMIFWLIIKPVVNSIEANKRRFNAFLGALLLVGLVGPSPLTAAFAIAVGVQVADRGRNGLRNS